MPGHRAALDCVWPRLLCRRRQGHRPEPVRPSQRTALHHHLLRSGVIARRSIRATDSVGCPGRSAARSDALQTRDRQTPIITVAHVGTEIWTVPDQRCTAPQALRAAPHPGRRPGARRTSPAPSPTPITGCRPTASRSRATISPPASTHSVEGGYRFATVYGGVTPYAAIQAQSFRTPSYSETDGSGLGFALSYNARTGTDTRSELGACFDRLIALNPSAALALRGRLAWAHDWVSDPTL